VPSDAAAIELDGRIITEGDDILLIAAGTYEPLEIGMKHPTVLSLRQLDDCYLAWCAWLLSNKFRSARTAEAALNL